MNNQQLAEIKRKLSMTTPGDWIAYVNEHDRRIIEDAKKDTFALLEEIECLQNKLAGMEQQIMVMDAENASLTRQLAVVRSWSIAKPNDERV